jgi:sec-independent protein translocase protein TatB
VPGFQEWMVIAVVALLIIGPNRLPDVARTAGRTLARLRREASTAMAALKEDAELEGLGDELRALRGEVRDTKRVAGEALRGATGLPVADTKRPANERPAEIVLPQQPPAGSEGSEVQTPPASSHTGD